MRAVALAAVAALSIASPAHAVVEQPIAGGPTSIGFGFDLQLVDESPIFDSAPVDGAFNTVRADLTARARYRFTSAVDDDAREFFSRIVVEYTDAFDGNAVILTGGSPASAEELRSVALVAGETYDIVFEFAFSRLISLEYGTSDPADELFRIRVLTNFVDFEGDDFINPEYIVSYSGFVTDAVPAPAALALFGLGALGAAALRRSGGLTPASPRGI